MQATRRAFLLGGAAAIAGTKVTEARTFASRPWGVAPSDRIAGGVIGCNGRGSSDLTSLLKLPEVECVALCDVDRNVRERRAQDVEQTTGTKPALYEDFRRVLDDGNIDAVVIGTPDHWH